MVAVGFLGGGMMCQVGHLPFYVEHDNCEVVAIAEPRPSLHAHLVEMVGHDVVIDDYRDMLARPDVDAVVISAPRPATASLTLAALESGKHVLAEKPMAHTVDQARRLVETADKNGLAYSVGYMKRFDPGVERAKALFDDLLDSGHLGHLLFARVFDYSKSYAFPVPPHKRPEESRSVRFETWPTEPDWLPSEWADLYRWYLNSACHDVNLSTLFFGPDLRPVDTRFVRSGGVTSTFDSNGVTVRLDIAKTGASEWIEGAEFVFERGRLTLAIPTPMNRDALSTVVLEEEGKSPIDHTPASEGTKTWSFARQARGFIDALAGHAPLRNCGREGLADMVLIDALWRRVGD